MRPVGVYPLLNDQTPKMAPNVPNFEGLAKYRLFIEVGDGH